MKIGLVPGKFMPPHNGSLSLCKVAETLSDKLVIILLDNLKDSMSIKIRKTWLEKELPGVLIKIVKTKTDYLTVQSSKLLLTEIYDQFPNSKIHLFGSEMRLFKIAEQLRTEFTILDPNRLGQNIHSDSILFDPYGHWLDLPSSVRVSLVKRVVLVGPESVGKSSLAKKLSEFLQNSSYLPEYGRNYETFRKSGTYHSDELLKISITHAAHRNALLPFSGPVFIEDTDEMITSVWSEMLLQRTFSELDQQIKLPELYLLMDPSVPFIAEKTRYFNNEKRDEFYRRIKHKLESLNANYKILTGSWDTREKTALRIVSELLSSAIDWSKL